MGVHVVVVDFGFVEEDALAHIACTRVCTPWVVLMTMGPEFLASTENGAAFATRVILRLILVVTIHVGNKLVCCVERLVAISTLVPNIWKIHIFSHDTIVFVHRHVLRHKRAVENKYIS